MGLNFLLDTNIISELSKSNPNPQVIKYLHIYGGQCITATLVMHELNFGILRLVECKLKNNLLLKQLEKYNFPVLSYDAAAAQIHATERTKLASKGLTPLFVDGQIASIAQVNDLVLVTRNTKDFKDFLNIKVESWFD